MYILGIESTCDETAASVVENGRILKSSVIASSCAEQALYGGVVPEIASRRHVEAISATVNKALATFAHRGWIRLEGKSVLILERHNRPGGIATSFSRSGI